MSMTSASPEVKSLRKRSSNPGGKTSLSALKTPVTLCLWVNVFSGNTKLILIKGYISVNQKLAVEAVEEISFDKLS